MDFNIKELTLMLFRIFCLFIINQLLITTNSIAAPHLTNHSYTHSIIHPSHHPAISKTAKTKMQSLAAIA
jgi:hypothetical protein